MFNGWVLQHSMVVRLFSSVHLLSHVWLFVTPWTSACQASLSITNSWSYPNSCPLSQWYNPTISSSVIPFSSCPQSFPASASFPMLMELEKSLLQHHSSKASGLHHSAFFKVQLSHPYLTTGKTRALTRRTFVDKVMSLLFNMLSRLVITFLPRRKSLLISWVQSSSAVILEPPK